LTSLRVGGPAALFAEPATPEEVGRCLQWAAETATPVLALGGGTNLLIADTGYPGLVLRYRDRSLLLEERGETAQVLVACGHPFSLLARQTAAAGWAGLEWAEGIPGTIGGAVAGNAGAYGGTVGENLVCAEYASALEPRCSIPAEECGFTYRASRFARSDPRESFLLSARFALRRDDPKRLRSELARISALRRSRTPAGLSCGSVFKNPPGDSAGRLIESTGLKGARHGGAQISLVHANYIVNLGGATAADVNSLISLARERVFQEAGVRLELEVKLIGF